MTKTLRISYCTELVCGRVLATVREALAVAPALSEIRTTVVRVSEPDGYGRRQPECLLAVTFDRQALSNVDWQTATAARIVNDSTADLHNRQTPTMACGHWT